MGEPSKESKIKEINTRKDLKEGFGDIMKNHEDIKDQIFHVLLDYSNGLHFGYMLLEVKNGKGEL